MRRKYFHDYFRTSALFETDTINTLENLSQQIDSCLLENETFYVQRSPEKRATVLVNMVSFLTDDNAVRHQSVIISLTLKT